MKYQDGVENLLIYQISYKLMIEIHKESLKFPKIERPSEATTPQRSEDKAQVKRNFCWA